MHFVLYSVYIDIYSKRVVWEPVSTLSRWFAIQQEHLLSADHAETTEERRTYRPLTGTLKEHHTHQGLGSKHGRLEGLLWCWNCQGIRLIAWESVSEQNLVFRYVPYAHTADHDLLDMYQQQTPALCCETTYLACLRILGYVQVLTNVEQHMVPFFFDKHVDKSQLG